MYAPSTPRWILFCTVFSLAAAGCNGQRTDGNLAQSPPGARAFREGIGPRMPMNPERFLQRFDQNANGTLELSELPAPMQERFRAADTDHNGTLSAEEMAAHRATLRAAHFARIDTNNDGALTADEVGPRWERLNPADTDHDNRITRAEFEQAQNSGLLRPRGFGGRGGWAGRGGRWNPQNGPNAVPPQAPGAPAAPTAPAANAPAAQDPDGLDDDEPALQAPQTPQAPR